MNYQEIIKYNDSIKDKIQSNLQKDSEILDSLISCKAQSDNRDKPKENGVSKLLRLIPFVTLKIFPSQSNLN